MIKKTAAICDSDYVSRRNGCIFEAEKYANRRNGSVYGLYDKYTSDEEWRASWNKDFHSKMNELSKSGFVRQRISDDED